MEFGSFKQAVVSIKLASPEEIRAWSYGEVKKPETINYRTYRPEKDGLFCEKIFGPERDWECSCGKYKGIKYKGIVCDRCGVEITLSKVRRKRMAHITLAAPVVHIWFFKTIPSRIGTLLGIKMNSLERIIYYQDYIVTDVYSKDKSLPLREMQILSEEEYHEYKERFRDAFACDTGGAAIRKLLSKVNLQNLSDELRKSLSSHKSSKGLETTETTAVKDLLKRLKIVDSFLQAGIKPEWMVLTVVPVIPPELRPLVLLESGNFATSDINELYRRLINRNNRLKKLIELNAPEVIIKNEKRMLQQSVDALFDNTRCRRPVLGSNNRPLKSLADILKGKSGRFRENLLGKRVDYSARSVIVVGPELKLHQCAIPKRIALELYSTFIIRRLKELGKVDTIKMANKVLECRDDIVWDILEEVSKNHPVLLNRAPTLHRMSIQAFEPVLVDGDAIKLHPLVCPPFNADFDGDQMAVHLPLSLEAQLEARLLMMSTQNIFSTAHGNPIISPTQDIILGLHYLTLARSGTPGEGLSFPSLESPVIAWELGKLHLHAPINCRFPPGKQVLGPSGEMEAPQGQGGLYQTTVGRIIFNEILPPEAPFYNVELSKRLVGKIIMDVRKLSGTARVVKLLDDLKELGFKAVTLSGLSLSKDDLPIPSEKQEIIKKAQQEVALIERSYRKGIITAGERYNQIIDCWINAREEISKAMLNRFKNDVRQGKPYLNPLYHMIDSGARGSADQVRQLAGIRGLMAKPSGMIIETPITSNFKEGLSALEYFSSTHGARKGLADTALKTADAGYLTRKLVDVAQNVVVTMHDCGTLAGITVSVIYKGDTVDVPLSQIIRGRVARDTITDIVTDRVIVSENEIITDSIASEIESLGYQKIRIRSPMTCEAPRGVCAMCYGWDLSKSQLVELGTAVGIIAAQSIGEPGTQLTMKTFHIGGIATRTLEENEVKAKSAGTIRLSYARIAEIPTSPSPVVVNRNAELKIVDPKGRELERHAIPVGAHLLVRDNQEVKPKSVLFRWDPHNVPILAGVAGRVRFDDIIKDKTMLLEVDPGTGVTRRIITHSSGNLHPQIVIEDPKTGAILEVHPAPEGAHLEVFAGDIVTPGTILAKTPREVRGTQDITGGLPRVTELFEAKRPSEPAVLSEIDGLVELSQQKGKGRRIIVVRNPKTGMRKEHQIPFGRHLRVRAGDYVRAGEPLTEGPLVPQELLRICGEETLQQYLLREIQQVYRSQDVLIDNKHIEIIIAQMLRKVRVINPGDTKFLPNAIVDKAKLLEENQRVKSLGKTPATYKRLLFGITKSAIQSESFLAAASFQETTKVLTEAAIAARKDYLTGIKENVLVGRPIPAGTGTRALVASQLIHKGEPAAESSATSTTAA